MVGPTASPKAPKHGVNFTSPMKNWAPSSQAQSAFFNRLPREIRDMIYDIAFGDEQRDFHFNSLVVAASAGEPTNQSPLHGLNTWLLASKAICIEAMETFSRTRRFSPRFRGQAKSSISNSLVLHENSIRNITLHFPYDSHLMGTNPRHAVHSMPPYMFLKSFGPFFTEHPCLSLHWEVKYFWKKEPRGYMSWPSKWNGRFRTVEVHLNCRFIEELEMEAYGETAETAERVGLRLVGDSAGTPPAMVWGSESKELAWKNGEMIASRRRQRLLILRKV